MQFLAPLWLTLLVPWLALVAWTWWRIADERATTAAFLWKHEAPETSTPRRRELRRPPAWVLQALTAILLTVLAMAGPAFGTRVVRVSVVVDASAALSAIVDGRSLRDALIDRAQSQVKAAGVRVNLAVPVAGAVSTEAHELDAARSFPFTARSTDRDIAAAIQTAERDADAVIVLTSQPLPPTGDRVAVLAASDVQNVGIQFAVGVAMPKPSLMVRLACAADAREVTLVIRGEGWQDQRKVSLSGQRQTVDAFFDLPPSPGEQIEVQIADANDGLPIDDVATLLRTRGSPTLVLEGDVPPAATRFAAAYARSRGRDASGTVRVVVTADESSASPQLILASPTIPAQGELVVADSPLVRDIDLGKPSIAKIAVPPAGDWKTVASVGGHPILCTREQPARAVWIGVELDPSQLRSVVLLSNVIDWLSESTPSEWRGESPDAVGNDWKQIYARLLEMEASPGTYRNAAGQRVAVNVPAMSSTPVESRGDIVRLLHAQTRVARRTLRPWLAFLAACFVIAAAVSIRLNAANLDVSDRVP